MNRMNIFKTATAVLLTLTTVTSCFEDKGNYEYIELDEVVIDVEKPGINNAYAITKFDTLSINPDVYFNGQLVNGNEQNFPLDFEWSIYNTMTGAGTSTAVTVLGNEIELCAPITVTEGQWTVRLIVEHRKTKIREYQLFSCQVNEALSDGMLVLYEPTDEPGTTDVGLIINSLVKKNYNANKCFTNLYKNANGTHLAGTPRGIFHSVSHGIVGANGGYRDVMINTSEDFVGVGYASFERQLNFEDMFWVLPEQCNLQYYTPHQFSCESVINDNVAYHADLRTVGESGTLYGIPYGGEYGTLASWIPTFMSNNYDMVAYDQENQRFVCAPYGALELGSFTPDYSQVADAENYIPAFDVNNVGLELLMSDWGFTQTANWHYEYSIMRDNNDNSTWLLISDFHGSNVTSPYIPIDKIDISNSPKVEDITSMSCGSAGDILFYGAENSVYLLKYVTGQNAEEFYKFPAEEKVTCVRVHKFYYPQLMSAAMKDGNKILHVGTYNETTGEGKVYMFPIDPTNGSITGDHLVYGGFGKIKDIAWKYGLTL